MRHQQTGTSITSQEDASKCLGESLLAAKEDVSLSEPGDTDPFFLFTSQSIELRSGYNIYDL